MTTQLDRKTNIGKFVLNRRKEMLARDEGKPYPFDKNNDQTALLKILKDKKKEKAW